MSLSVQQFLKLSPSKIIMFRSRLVKLIVSLVLTVVLAFSGIVPLIGQMHPAYAADFLKKPSETDSEFALINSPIDSYQLDKYLIDALRTAHDSTEEFAASELDEWVNHLMKKVDDKFLTWYFSYFNQKAMEFGIPFAWLVFAGDYSLNFLRQQGDKKLNPNQVLQKKMIEDFQIKFTELVFNPEDTQKYLSQLTERVARNYASALGMQLATIKNAYRIPDGNWERYLNELANVVYDTGNSKYSLSPESLTSRLATVTTAGVGGKLALNFAAKVAAKIGTKAGGALAAKVAAQFVDPLVAVGLLIWDTWDYKHMVDESRHVLRQNIWEYLNEVKMSIFNAPDNSIMAAIEEVEGKIIAGLESRLTSY